MIKLDFCLIIIYTILQTQEPFNLIVDYAVRFHIETPIEVGLTTLSPAEAEYTLFEFDALNTTVGLSLSVLPPPVVAYDDSCVILNAPDPVKFGFVALLSLIPFSLPVMFGREPLISAPSYVTSDTFHSVLPAASFYQVPLNTLGSSGLTEIYIEPTGYIASKLILLIRVP